MNSHMKHGLFGVVDGQKAEDIKSIKELSQYIEAKTQAGTIVYRAVISLAEDDAMRLGYDDPEQFRELVRARLPDICEKINIPIHNLEYTAAIHRDKGHPHVHLMFWDKSQEIRKEAFVHPSVSNSIRTGLIKHVFSDEMAAFQSIKDEARKAALDNLGGFFGEFAEAFADMTPGDYAAAAQQLKLEADLADGRLIYNRFKSADMKELAADLLRLVEHIPKTGRLSFKLMSPEVKDEIITFLEKVLNKNADCDREFKKYVYAATELSRFYTDKPETHTKAGKTAYDDMMKRLGNVVLREVKKMMKQAKDAEWSTERNTGRYRESIESLITELFGVLARAANAENKKVHHMWRASELSKQAKKELAMKKENSSGYEWE